MWGLGKMDQHCSHHTLLIGYLETFLYEDISRRRYMLNRWTPLKSMKVIGLKLVSVLNNL